ncbi:hypothetical protein P6U21_29645, partial [Bacillus paranthracis]|nr:hypothetical protein [Bacillus paranthracis]
GDAELRNVWLPGLWPVGLTHGTGDFGRQVGWYLGGWLISVIMGAVLTYLFGFKDSMAERIMD